MPRRYWLSVVALAGILAGSVQAQPISGNGNHRDDTQPRETQVSNAAAPTIPAAIQIAINRIASALEAANSHPNAGAEDQRAKDNLKAQQDTAKWAAWMLVVAGLETAVTFMGVVLVALTLSATRAAAKAARDAVLEAEKATKATRDIGEAQTRAYLTCENGDFLATQREVHLWPKFKNTGQSPAVRVNIQGTINVWCRTLDKELDSLPFDKILPAIAAGVTGWTKIELDTVPRGFEDAFSKTDTYYTVIGTVSWTDVFNKESVLGFRYVRAEGVSITGSDEGRILKGELHVAAQMTEDDLDLQKYAEDGQKTDS